MGSEEVYNGTGSFSNDIVMASFIAGLCELKTTLSYTASIRAVFRRMTVPFLDDIPPTNEETLRLIFNAYFIWSQQGFGTRKAYARSQTIFSGFAHS